MKIALLPGGFKPPHLGHYNMAKYLADSADEVIVRIGRTEIVTGKLQFVIHITY